MRSSQPFIYVAAMPRSGSTMLAGILSQPSISHIFSEIGLNRGLTHGFQQLAEFDNRFPDLLSTYQGKPQMMLRTFAQEVLPKLAAVVPHLGVKECFHENWQLYPETVGEVRFVVLARDPRDVMLSILDYGDRVNWHRQLWSDKGDDYIARRHNEVWAQQRAMLKRSDAVAVRYEDICLDPKTFIRLSRFCELPLNKPASASRVIEAYPWRSWEISKHRHNLVGAESVYRWKRESNPTRRSRAFRLGELMQDYCRFWGYES
jgi:hypothetical protein